MTNLRSTFSRRTPSFTDNTTAVIEHDRITAAVLAAENPSRIRSP